MTIKNPTSTTSPTTGADSKAKKAARRGSRGEPSQELLDSLKAALDAKAEASARENHGSPKLSPEQTATAMHPATAATIMLNRLAFPGEGIDLPSTMQHLMASAEVAAAGNLTSLKQTLAIQAQALDRVFSMLARREIGRASCRERVL